MGIKASRVPWIIIIGGASARTWQIGEYASNGSEPSANLAPKT